MKVSLWSEPPPVVQRVSAPLEEYILGASTCRSICTGQCCTELTAFPSTLPYLQPAAMMHAQLVNMALGVDHDTKHIHSQHIECVKSVRFIVGLACRTVQRESPWAKGVAS